MLLSLENVTKYYGGTLILDHVNLKLEDADRVGLIGVNGAGKSTLMSVLFGLYQPEEGEILMNGKKVKIDNPNDANALGIGMVHQHFKLVHNFIEEDVICSHLFLL